MGKYFPVLIIDPKTKLFYMTEKTKISLISLYSFDSFAVRGLFSILEKENIDSTAIFLKDLKTNDIKTPTEKEIDLLIGLLKQEKPTAVALSVRSPFRQIAIELTNNIRSELGVPIIWGGTDVILCPEEAIKYADAICFSEGDRAISSLIKAVSSKTLAPVAGCWIKGKNEIIKGEKIKIEMDLNNLPFPVRLHDKKFFIDDDEFKADPISFNTRYDIMASRGCPFVCSYCCSSSIMNITGDGRRSMRVRSVDNVIEELKLVKNELPHVKRVFFVDEIFGVNKEWAKEFSNKYRKEIGLPFMAELYPTTINSQNINLLASAGMESVSVGIQSGDQTIRADYLQRPVTDDQLLKSGSLLKEAGIRPIYDVIMDMPFADEHELKSTLDLLLKLPRPYDLNLFSLVHFPKTPLTNRLLNDGTITEDDVEGRNKKSWDQWRVSFSYERDDIIRFYGGLISLLSKSFISKRLIRAFSKSKWLKNSPRTLALIVNFSNLIKSAQRGLTMLFRGQLNLKTIKRYVRSLAIR